MAVHSVSLSFPVSVYCVKSWIYFYMFLWTSWYNTSVTGKQVIGSQDVLVKVGDEVILPCHIEPPVNMARQTVEWSRSDLKPVYVHVLQNGRYNTVPQNPLYVKRTSLFAEELQLGNISLKLTSVKLSDEGTYKCFAPDLRSSSLINLLVGNVSQPVISLNGPEDGGLSLTCDSGCWYPQPEMSWQDSDGNITAEPSVTQKPSQHCYIVQSNVTVRTAGRVTCRVHLPHINRTADGHHTITGNMIPTERGSTAGGRGGPWIVTVIFVTVIMLVAVLGYLYWKNSEHVKDFLPVETDENDVGDLITNDVEIRIVMVGKTGAGKSATGNTILGSESFKAEFSPISVTKTCSKASGVVSGRKVSVIDTPGLFDTGFSNTETIKEVKNCITCAAPGPHVFLYVISVGRYTEEEKNVVAKIQKEFGESSDKYTMILFTYGDQLEGQTIQEFVKNSTELNELISKYSGFYHVFDNESKDPSQVTELLEKINQMVKKNTGSHYTNQMFQEAARKHVLINDEEIRIVMVGKTGAGKSATGNTILGPEAFESRGAANSVTKTCYKASGVVAGREVSVIDTPGLFDTKFSEDETIQEVKNCITCAAPGPQVFLAVIKLGRYTDEEKKVVAKIQEKFGQSSDKYTMILFTHGDSLKLKGQTIEEFVKDSPELRDLISKYNGHYHVFDNKSKDPSQVTELLEIINQMVKKNGGSHYTNHMFQEAARKQVRLVQAVVRQVQKAVTDKDEASLLDSLRLEALGLRGVMDDNAQRYLDQLTNKTVVLDKEEIQRVVISCNAAAERQKLNKRQCEVLYDYQAQQENQLELEVGDIIDFIKEGGHVGWWFGTLNGKSGYFPSNYVKEVEASGAETERHFVDKHRPFLIQRVTNVYPILDLLFEERVITMEGYRNVRSKTTTLDQMRELYALLTSRKAKDIFYEGLEEHEKFLLWRLK